ncbi:MAG: hypothetical protein OES38_06385 [Gammaproteobacteria bacterium]|nr:hypothetical protein [Gammaproteobacteria bacterium]
MLLKDISRAIERQYSHELLNARRTIAEIQHLGPRVVRCVIFLANGDLQQLEYYTQQALQDPRDVMYWAEYDRDTDEQLRDFNEPFT